MTCKDCIHYAVCKEHEKIMLTVNNLYELIYQSGVEVSCKHFSTADVVPKSEELRKERLCKVGDKIFIINEDEAGIVVEENKVTEVGERYIFFSGFYPPEDDVTEYVAIADLGKDIFLDEDAARIEVERRCAKREVGDVDSEEEGVK